MKHFTYSLLIITSCLILTSWGYKGHKAVASIALLHTNFNVVPEISKLLEGKEMSDIASWADEIRDEPEYKYTAPWHFLNLPLGLSQDQFKQAVLSQSQPNIYSAIIKCEADLTSKDTPEKQKQDALRFLIHLVGDAHQPMHISRKEDKGGNTIQVRFDDRGTNLHSVWDTKLIDHEGLTDREIVNEYDKATDAEIKRWQSDDVISWLWESYQISSKLYAEVESNNKLDESYYKSHIGIVHKRIDQAGIRLAGVLNRVFKNDAKVKIKLLPQPPINKPYPRVPKADLKDAASLIGNEVEIKGDVYGYKELDNLTLVNLGAAYPNQLLTVVLKGDANQSVKNLNGKSVTVVGTLVKYKGKPEIIVTDPAMFVIHEQSKVEKVQN